MDSLITQVITWPSLLIALVAFGFAPGALLRVIVLAFKRDDPRRKELLAELPHIPRLERPFWVFEQLEVALFEGLLGRLAKRTRSKVHKKGQFAPYSTTEFYQTATSRRLTQILTGNGGAYGVYGPRGSGKSWLLLHAIHAAQAVGGTGLWFPCPRDYDTAALLTALADTLASTVERRYHKHRNSRARHLVREATSLRERIRYTAALMMAAEVSVGGGGHLVAVLKHARQKAPDERPQTIAALVHDFRRLAELLVSMTQEPVVIGIDELDKIEEPEVVRNVLRDINGIFEIPGVFFLVSVSEAAAAGAQIESLLGRDRYQPNSSFSALIALPPLSPHEIIAAMQGRGITLNDQRAAILCMLSGGNWRDAVRLFANTGPLPAQDAADLPDWEINFATGTMAAEAAALRSQIIQAYGRDAGASTVLPDVWRALPDAAFYSPDALEALGRSAIHDFWDLGQSDAIWRDTIIEPWRRMLIRLFVIAHAIAAIRTSQATQLDHKYASDLCDVLIIAGHNTETARLMLAARFGEDLKGPYMAPPRRP